MWRNRTVAAIVARVRRSWVVGRRGIEALRRRNVTVVVIDVVYLFTTAFLAVLPTRGPGPAVVVAGPLVAMLYFAWRASIGFLLANLLVAVLAVLAAFAGVVPS